MKTVISASRRTDLPAFFPDRLAASLRAKTVCVLGPRGQLREVDLDPRSVHTVVLWSKNFRNLVRNAAGLRDLLAAYDQLYLHFTVTGLGGTPAEAGAPDPGEALAQLRDLVAITGLARRVSLRFDPILFWREGRAIHSNLPSFGKIAVAAASLGIRDIRVSFAQWYRKSRKRASVRGFDFVDPPEDEKKTHAAALADEAGKHGLDLYACCQPFLKEADGIRPSACIDGRLLQSLHPGHETVSCKKDVSQRAGCLCTESVDIGSYAQICPHGCVYCYANPAA
ncbi:MAG: DUF1848 family protein [Candidatus Aminicenantales bacterium]